MNTSQRLHALCEPHPDRHVGGPGNRAANDLFADEVAAAGFSVERIAFEAAEWVPGEAWLEVGGERFDAARRAVLRRRSTARRHSWRSRPSRSSRRSTRPGSILLLHGPIAAEQLTPRNYPFYSSDEHARILSALDAARPAAVVAATGRTPMAAGLYPFPLFEDGDLGHPSAYLRDVDGEQTARARGRARSAPHRLAAAPRPRRAGRRAQARERLRTRPRSS